MCSNELWFGSLPKRRCQKPCPIEQLALCMPTYLQRANAIVCNKINPESPPTFGRQPEPSLSGRIDMLSDQLAMAFLTRAT